MAVILLIGGLTAIFMFFAWIAFSVADNGVKASTQKVIRVLGESAAKQPEDSLFGDKFSSPLPKYTFLSCNIHHNND